MSKYIIDTDQFGKLFEAKVVAVLGIGNVPKVSEDGEKTVWTRTFGVDGLEELNSDYINEHFGDLQDDAYKRGINDGSLDVKQRVEGAYQRGLDDAWEAAKKIFGYEIDGGILIDKIGKVFGYSEDAIFCTADIIRHNTASEAIAKLKAYEEKQKADDKIEVGDELIAYGGLKCIATVADYDNDIFYVLFGDGSSGKKDVTTLKKTGRHFDIASILEEMRHDS